jgi:hypothetical protein
MNLDPSDEYEFDAGDLFIGEIGNQYLKIDNDSLDIMNRLRDTVPISEYKNACYEYALTNKVRLYEYLISNSNSNVKDKKKYLTVYTEVLYDLLMSGNYEHAIWFFIILHVL